MGKKISRANAKTFVKLATQYLRDLGAVPHEDSMGQVIEHEFVLSTRYGRYWVRLDGGVVLYSLFGRFLDQDGAKRAIQAKLPLNPYSHKYNHHWSADTTPEAAARGARSEARALLHHFHSAAELVTEWARQGEWDGPQREEFIGLVQQALFPTRA